jgi:hypothetical protein
MMRNFFLPAFFILGGLFCSHCTTDDVDPLNSGPEYKNQIVQGKINGQSWVFVEGYANSFNFTGDTSNHTIDLTDSILTTGVCGSSTKRPRIIFGFQDRNFLIMTGESKLKIDLVDVLKSRTVTFLHYEGGSPVNAISTKGGYEILSVDTANSIITGRIDSRIDDENFVNGNFSLKYCVQ